MIITDKEIKLNTKETSFLKRYKDLPIGSYLSLDVYYLETYFESFILLGILKMKFNGCFMDSSCYIKQEDHSIDFSYEQIMDVVRSRNYTSGLKDQTDAVGYCDVSKVIRKQFIEQDHTVRKDNKSMACCVRLRKGLDKEFSNVINSKAEEKFKNSIKECSPSSSGYVRVKKVKVNGELKYERE